MRSQITKRQGWVKEILHSSAAAPRLLAPNYPCSPFPSLPTPHPRSPCAFPPVNEHINPLSQPCAVLSQTYSTPSTTFPPSRLPLPSTSLPLPASPPLFPPSHPHLSVRTLIHSSTPCAVLSCGVTASRAALPASECRSPLLNALGRPKNMDG
ncbi:unnamed protein product [Closterium sp. NIES-53]